jgi:PAS domain S-box-containing protein
MDKKSGRSTLEDIARSLHDRETLSSILFDNDILAICIFDVETGRILRANKKLESLYGYTEKDLLSGMTAYNLSAEEDASRLSVKLTERKGSSRIALRYHRKKDGSVFPVGIIAKVCALNNRRVMVAFVRDISDRKNMEQTLAKSEIQYRTLFEMSNDGIFVLDMEGHFLDANATAYQRLGYTKDELLSLYIHDLDDPAFAQRVPDRMKTVDEQGSLIFESAHLRKDGSSMPVEVSSRILEYNGQKAYLSIIRDITERKEAEAKVKKLTGLLPICAYCKKIRDDKGYWQEVAYYVSSHSEALFSHGMCPDCAKKAHEKIEQFKEADPEGQ